MAEKAIIDIEVELGLNKCSDPDCLGNQCPFAVWCCQFNKKGELSTCFSQIIAKHCWYCGAETLPYEKKKKKKENQNED